MTASAAKQTPPYGAVALRKEVIEELDRVASKLGLSRDELAEKAMLPALEDIDDQYEAEVALKEWHASGREAVSLEDVEKRLGLDR
ncbi:MAG: hypothetical protein RLZZ496_1805 [Pseudomonadota bacterium]|jgi:predicted DNA-binding protein|nr:hypothetical protein [Alphaproteobacteria bacterium]